MKKSVSAFSLIEMLITIAILAIVLLIATQTLNTVFRVSTISKFKSVTRNEIGFSIELLERLLANSNVVDVYLYDSLSARTYNEETGLIEDDPTANLSLVYGDQIVSGLEGSEIHIRPYGYSIWVCIGHFKAHDNPERGYLLKRTVPNLRDYHDHGSCFDTAYLSDAHPVLSLTSEDVKVEDFGISYIRSSNLNNVFYVNLTMEPTSWVPGDSSSLERSIVRQAVVTTQGLTWY